MRNQEVNGIGWAIAGVITASGMGYIGYRVFLRQKEIAVQTKSSTLGSAANFARRLKMAFDNDGWWGTDNDVVFEVFRQIPTKYLYAQVQKVYPLLDGGRTLDAALQDEMSTTQRNELDKILDKKRAK